MIIQVLDTQKTSITGDTVNYDQFIHSAEVCALFPARLDLLRGILALHVVRETDDRDIVFQKRQHLTMGRQYQPTSPTSATLPLQELTQLHQLCQSPQQLAATHGSFQHEKSHDPFESGWQSIGESHSTPRFPKMQATLGSPGASIHPDVNLSCHLK